MNNALDQAINNVSSMLSGAGQAIGQGIGQMEQNIFHGSQHQNPTPMFSYNGQNNTIHPNNAVGSFVGGMANFLGYGPAQQAINNTLTDAQQAAQQNIGDPLGRGLQATGSFARNTILNPAIWANAIADSGSLYGMEGAKFLPAAAPAALKFATNVATSTALPSILSGGLAQYAQPETQQELQQGQYGKAAQDIGTTAASAALLGTGINLGVQGISAVAQKMFGPKSDLYIQAANNFGGNDAAQSLVGNLYGKYKEDTYRLMANKNLIQKVITGQGSRADIQQFNVLNSLGQKNPIAPKDGTVATTGTVWNFLKDAYPNSFKGTTPIQSFIDPKTTPLQSLTELQLSPEQNQSLMKLSTTNPSPADESVAKAKAELANKDLTKPALSPSMSDLDKQAQNFLDQKAYYQQPIQKDTPDISKLGNTTEDMINPENINELSAKANDFSQPQTKATNDFWRDAEYQLKYNTALQATVKMSKEEASQVSNLIYNTNVNDATNPLEMASIIFKNLPKNLQKNPEVLDAFHNYPLSVNQVFNMRIQGEKYNAQAARLTSDIPGQTAQEAFYRQPIKENTPDILGSGNSTENMMNPASPQELANAVSQESIMQHPDVAQYAGTIKKAVKAFTADPTHNFSTLGKKVPGFDMAMNTMKEKGITLNSIDDLTQLAKSLPKGIRAAPPKTAAEGLAAKAGHAPTPTDNIVAEKATSLADIKKNAPELLTPQGKESVNSLIKGAMLEKSSIDKTLSSIAQTNGGEFTSRVKNPSTFIQKIVTKRQAGREYTPFDVNDTYGARITVPDNATKQNILDQVHTLTKTGGYELVKAENISKDTYNATHMDLKSPNGTRIELQLQTPAQKAESLVNHPIRSMFGETPPKAVNAVKQQNADIIAKMAPEEVQQLGKNLEAIHAANPEAATMKPIDLAKTNMGAQKIAAKIGNIPGMKTEDIPPVGGKIPPAKVPETRNKVTLPISGTTDAERVSSAIANSERISNEIKTRGTDAYIAGSKLSPNDIKLAEKWQPAKNQEATTISVLAKQAENPQAFTNFMNKITDYYDFRLAADHAVGGTTPMRENYLRQRWNLSDQSDLNLFNKLARQKGIKPWNGYSNQPRVFDTYAQGQAAGFKRLNPTILGDLQDDYKGANYILSQQALKQGLKQAVPDKVGLAGKGITAKGQSFINSNIKGLEGISLSPDIEQRLQGYQPLSQLNNANLPAEIKEKGIRQALSDSGVPRTFLYVYDHVSSPMKQFLLNFSGFHSLNISANYAGAQILHPIDAIKGLGESVPSFFSEKLTQNIIDGTKAKIIPGTNYSVFDAGLRSGVNMTRELPAQGIEKVNPFKALPRAIFDRELYTMKLNLIDTIFSSGKLDPESVMGRQAGAEINKIMGEINPREMNINPNLLKNASRLLLAPQFTASKYAVLKNAATSGGMQGSLARQAVIGKSIVLGSIATLGTKLMTGNFPALQQIIQNYTYNPQMQTNLTNPQGRLQDIALPQTFISEPLNPILSSIQQQSFSPALHYAQARENPFLSTIQAGVTNQDYYGNPIYSSASPTPALQQYASNLGIGKLPIGAQNLVRLQQGRVTPAQAAIQIAGLRTTTNKNDPTMKYFSDVAAMPKAFNFDANTLAKWNADLHPATKDVNGNPFENMKTDYTKAQNYAELLGNDKLLNAEQALQQKQPSHHPMWDLNPYVLKQYMQSQINNSVDPAGDKATAATFRTVLPQNFQQQLDSYYADLQKQGVKFPASAQPPAVSTGLQTKLDNYDTLQTPRDKAIYLQQNPEVGKYFDDYSTYNNIKRADRLEPLNIDKYTQLPTLNAAQIKNVEKNLLPAYKSLPSYQGEQALFLQQNPDMLSYILTGGNANYKLSDVMNNLQAVNAANQSKQLPLLQLDSLVKNGGTGSGTSSYSPQGMSNYMDRAMQAYYMRESLKQAIQSQQPVKVTLPSLRAQPIGAAMAAFRQGQKNPIQTTLSSAKIAPDKTQMPKIARAQFKEPQYSPTRLSRSPFATIS